MRHDALLSPPRRPAGPSPPRRVWTRGQGAPSRGGQARAAASPQREQTPSAAAQPSSVRRGQVPGDCRPTGASLPPPRPAWWQRLSLGRRGPRTRGPHCPARRPRPRPGFHAGRDELRGPGRGPGAAARRQHRGVSCCSTFGFATATGDRARRERQVIPTEPARQASPSEEAAVKPSREQTLPPGSCSGAAAGPRPSHRGSFSRKSE